MHEIAFFKKIDFLLVQEVRTCHYLNKLWYSHSPLSFELACTKKSLPIAKYYIIWYLIWVFIWFGNRLLFYSIFVRVDSKGLTRRSINTFSFVDFIRIFPPMYGVSTTYWCPDDPVNHLIHFAHVFYGNFAKYFAKLKKSSS